MVDVSAGIVLDGRIIDWTVKRDRYDATPSHNALFFMSSALNPREMFVPIT